MKENLVLKSVKKSIFDLLSMTGGQFFILILLFGWNCLRTLNLGFGSSLSIVFLSAWFEDLLESNIGGLQDAPMERKTFWKMIIISELLKRYAVAILLVLPILVRVCLAGQLSSFCNYAATILSIMFWVAGFRNPKKYSGIRHFFVLELVSMIAFLGMGAIADEADAPAWMLGLVVIFTLIYGFGKYFCLRNTEPYVVSEIMMKEEAA